MRGFSEQDAKIASAHVPELEKLRNEPETSPPRNPKSEIPLSHVPELEKMRNEPEAAHDERLF
jgi:hypothetical protein